MVATIHQKELSRALRRRKFQLKFGRRMYIDFTSTRTDIPEISPQPLPILSTNWPVDAGLAWALVECPQKMCGGLPWGPSGAPCTPGGFSRRPAFSRWRWGTGKGRR